MNTDDLLAEAQKGGFFSYAAGVAYQIMTHYRVHGLEIDNYLTDLPIKKGLSSSAAICVLVARAFNRIYDLKMTVRGEMEYAYLGEITTPSRCGRMDQGCAYGNRPVMMVFDGDRIDVKEVTVPRDLHYVIVDLGASKDTREILARLNRCYPFAENETQKNVQTYLGPVSAGITNAAFEALGQPARQPCQGRPDGGRREHLVDLGGGQGVARHGVEDGLGRVLDDGQAAVRLDRLQAARAVVERARKDDADHACAKSDRRRAEQRVDGGAVAVLARPAGQQDVPARQHQVLVRGRHVQAAGLQRARFVQLDHAQMPGPLQYARQHARGGGQNVNGDAHRGRQVGG
jgi:galactokinase